MQTTLPRPLIAAGIAGGLMFLLSLGIALAAALWLRTYTDSKLAAIAAGILAMFACLKLFVSRIVVWVLESSAAGREFERTAKGIGK